MEQPIVGYHVVTDRPMEEGQILRFEGESQTGVGRRVREKMGEVQKIYAHPEQYDAAQMEHHTKVALRELALERVRREKYPQYPSRLNCL